MEEKKIRKSRRQRGKKDPAAPKKGMTAFLFYIQENCPKYKNEHKDVTHKEAIVKLGEIWRSISDEEKKPYVQKANADKQLYAQRLREYQSKMDND